MLESYQVTEQGYRFTKLKVGDCVQLVGEDGNHRAGDFLRICYIIEELISRKIFLRGWRLRRNKYIDGCITPPKLNEVTILVE